MTRDNIPCNHVKLIWDFGRQSWLCSLCSAEYKPVPVANSPNSTTQYLNRAEAVELPGALEHRRTLRTLQAQELQALTAEQTLKTLQAQELQALMTVAEAADSMLAVEPTARAIRDKCFALVEQALSSASNVQRDTQR